MADDHGFYTPLGRTGLKIPRLCLGTVSFGGRVEEDAAHRLMDHALAQGINFLDTANIYGWRVHKGYTEEMLGRWLVGRRSEVLLATKVGNPMSDDPTDRGLSARHIVAACDASLRRLGTDWIDLYQMHTVDRAVPRDEIWQAMDKLVSQGKVRYVGSSNFAGWDLAATQEAAIRRDGFGLAAEQCVLNLVTRETELEVIPAAQAYGIGVLVWSPLHGGLLGGVLRKLTEGTAVKSAQGRAAAALHHHRETIAAYERFCAERERHPAELGMAWTLSRPGVTGLVIGPRTTEQLDGAINALHITLTEDELSILDIMFPPIGAGGPAPGAWMS
ncbi:oxidoreductase [Actinosynnema sp. ALI-1.44]|uniref:aldo/keto reductase n=1 Tax=Actinosynnema sp. ALI-1.44 TaxID=1933779 RepID=UPI00097C5AE9|nr:aldo/keto reductase [Actinosynnema sp. ALI-1.44]ONI76353.1 oxidoreductase [Actinosynnema sp. ALI-1.44]